MADPNGDTAMRVIRTAARCDHVIAVASTSRRPSLTARPRATSVVAGAVGVGAGGIHLQPASTPATERLGPILALAGADAPDKVKVADTGWRAKPLSMMLADASPGQSARRSPVTFGICWMRRTLRDRLDISAALLGDACRLIINHWPVILAIGVCGGRPLAPRSRRAAEIRKARSLQTPWHTPCPPLDDANGARSLARTSMR